MRKNLHWLVLTTIFVLSIVMAGIGTASPAEPAVHVEPKDNTAEVGETFGVNITVTDITEEESLYSWDCRITFDPGIINAVNATEGTFLTSTGYDTTWLPPNIDNITGTIDMGAIITPSMEWNGFPPNGAVGSGTLATVTFKAVGQGATGLDFKEKEMDTALYTVIFAAGDQNNAPIAHNAEGGVFSNAGPPIPLHLIAGVVGAVVVCTFAVFYFRRKRA
ncbi:MAG: hypothetical protein HWN68_14140 [Desulfobacterales bacterium]|nr:hypothetical protein [Desulfobacterales bacterium]